MARELLGCFFCIFILSLATVLCAKMTIRFQDNLRLVRFVLFFVWVAIADETGQGMISLSGALKGDPKSQAQLGFHYMTGSMEGTMRKWHLWWPHDTERGQYWLKKATENGSPVADAILAQAYMNGDGGLPQDSLQAANFLKRVLSSASVDNETKAQAAFNLCEIYSTPDGSIPQDMVQAFNYAVIASDAGDAQSSYIVAKMYESGEWIPQDYGKAMAYYQTAANNGNALALADLARIKGMMSSSSSP